MTSESCAESCWKNLELGLGGFPCSCFRASPVIYPLCLSFLSPLCHLSATQMRPSVGWKTKTKTNRIKERRKEQLCLQTTGVRHSPCPTLQFWGSEAVGMPRMSLGVAGGREATLRVLGGIFGAVLFLPAHQGHGADLPAGHHLPGVPLDRAEHREEK